MTTEKTTDNGQTTEQAMVSLLANADAIKATDVLVKAANSKDEFADSYAGLIAGIDGIKAVLVTVDNVKAFVNFCLTFRGVNSKGKTKRDANRLQYVKTQAALVLCERLDIAVAKKELVWSLEAFIESVKETLSKHEIELGEFVDELTGDTDNA
jgi:hypothetical protein